MKKLILQYERDFFSKKFCSDYSKLNNRIHNGFKEIGKTGILYKKDSIIDYLINL